MNELDLGSGEMLMLLPNISLINSKSEVRFSAYMHRRCRRSSTTKVLLPQQRLNSNYARSCRAQSMSGHTIGRGQMPNMMRHSDDILL